MAGLRRDQRGSATVVALALAAVIGLAALVAWAIADLVVVRHRAIAAADLAALAAAPLVDRGADAACARAADLAARNSARLVDCLLEGDDVVVTVESPVTGAAARLAAWASQSVPAVQARARAGPP